MLSICTDAVWTTIAAFVADENDMFNIYANIILILSFKISFILKVPNRYFWSRL